MTYRSYILSRREETALALRAGSLRVAHLFDTVVSLPDALELTVEQLLDRWRKTQFEGLTVSLHC